HLELGSAPVEDAGDHDVPDVHPNLGLPLSVPDRLVRSRLASAEGCPDRVKRRALALAIASPDDHRLPIRNDGDRTQSLEVLSLELNDPSSATHDPPPHSP